MIPQYIESYGRFRPFGRYTIMSLKRVFSIALFPFMLTGLPAEEGTIPEAGEKERGRTSSRRMRPPVRRSAQKNTQTEEETPGKERNPSTSSAHANGKNHHDHRPRESGKPVRGREEEKGKKERSTAQKELSRSARVKEKPLSNERLLGIFRRADEVSSWGEGFFTFQEQGSKRRGIVTAGTGSLHEVSFRILGEFSEGLAPV